MDGSAAKAAFVEIAARDGLERAIATLRTTPERLAAIRSTEGTEQAVRRSVLDRAATAGAQAAVARSELENQPPSQIPQAQVVARVPIATSELQATCEHGAALAVRERSARETLGMMPRRSELEHRIGQLADRLLAHEVRKLKRMVTAPRLALLAKITSTIRDAMLARDERTA